MATLDGWKTYAEYVDNYKYHIIKDLTLKFHEDRKGTPGPCDQDPTPKEEQAFAVSQFDLPEDTFTQKTYLTTTKDLANRLSSILVDYAQGRHVWILKLGGKMEKETDKFWSEQDESGKPGQKRPFTKFILMCKAVFWNKEGETPFDEPIQQSSGV